MAELIVIQQLNGLRFPAAFLYWKIAALAVDLVYTSHIVVAHIVLDKKLCAEKPMEARPLLAN